MDYKNEPTLEFGLVTHKNPGMINDIFILQNFTPKVFILREKAGHYSISQSQLISKITWRKNK